MPPNGSKNPPPLEVQAIIDCKLVRGKEQFLVQWRGTPMEQAVWELEENCIDCEHLIAAHRAKLATESLAALDRATDDALRAQLLRIRKRELALLAREQLAEKLREVGRLRTISRFYEAYVSV